MANNANTVFTVEQPRGNERQHFVIPAEALPIGTVSVFAQVFVGYESDADGTISTTPTYPDIKDWALKVILEKGETPRYEEEYRVMKALAGETERRTGSPNPAPYPVMLAKDPTGRIALVMPRYAKTFATQYREMLGETSLLDIERFLVKNWIAYAHLIEALNQIGYVCIDRVTNEMMWNAPEESLAVIDWNALRPATASNRQQEINKTALLWHVMIFDVELVNSHHPFQNSAWIRHDDDNTAGSISVPLRILINNAVHNHITAITDLREALEEWQAYLLHPPQLAEEVVLKQHAFGKLGEYKRRAIALDLQWRADPENQALREECDTLFATIMENPDYLEDIQDDLTAAYNAFSSYDNAEAQTILTAMQQRREAYWQSDDEAEINRIQQAAYTRLNTILAIDVLILNKIEPKPVIEGLKRLQQRIADDADSEAATQLGNLQDVMTTYNTIINTLDPSDRDKTPVFRLFLAEAQIRLHYVQAQKAGEENAEKNRFLVAQNDALEAANKLYNTVLSVAGAEHYFAQIFGEDTPAARLAKLKEQYEDEDALDKAVNKVKQHIQQQLELDDEPGIALRTVFRDAPKTLPVRLVDAFHDKVRPYRELVDFLLYGSIGATIEADMNAAQRVEKAAHELDVNNPVRRKIEERVDKKVNDMVALLNSPASFANIKEATSLLQEIINLETGETHRHLYGFISGAVATKLNSVIEQVFNVNAHIANLQPVHETSLTAFSDWENRAKALGIDTHDPTLQPYRLRKTEQNVAQEIQAAKKDFTTLKDGILQDSREQTQQTIENFREEVIEPLQVDVNKISSRLNKLKEHVVEKDAELAKLKEESSVTRQGMDEQFKLLQGNMFEEDQRITKQIERSNKRLMFAALVALILSIIAILLAIVSGGSSDNSPEQVVVTATTVAVSDVSNTPVVDASAPEVSPSETPLDQPGSLAQPENTTDTPPSEEPAATTEMPTNAPDTPTEQDPATELPPENTPTLAPTATNTDVPPTATNTPTATPVPLTLQIGVNPPGDVLPAPINKQSEPLIVHVLHQDSPYTASEITLQYQILDPKQGEALIGGSQAGPSVTVGNGTGATIRYEYTGEAELEESRFVDVTVIGRPDIDPIHFELKVVAALEGAPIVTLEDRTDGLRSQGFWLSAVVPDETTTENPNHITLDIQTSPYHPINVAYEVLLAPEGTTGALLKFGDNEMPRDTIGSLRTDETGKTTLLLTALQPGLIRLTIENALGESDPYEAVFPIALSEESLKNPRVETNATTSYDDWMNAALHIGDGTFVAFADVGFSGVFSSSYTPVYKVYVVSEGERQVLVPFFVEEADVTVSSSPQLKLDTESLLTGNFDSNAEKTQPYISAGLYYSITTQYFTRQRPYLLLWFESDPLAQQEHINSVVTLSGTSLPIQSLQTGEAITGYTGFMLGTAPMGSLAGDPVPETTEQATEEATSG